MKENRITLVFGQKGRGKSYAIKRQLDKMRRHAPLIVWDKNGEYTGPGGIDSIRYARQFTSLAAFLHEQAAQGGHVGRAVIVEKPERFAAFCRFAHYSGGLTVVIDELHLFVDKKHDLDALRDLLYTSRHRRIDVIAAAWRPTEIPIWIRHAADEIRAFQTSEPADLVWYTQKCGDAFAKRLPSLPLRRSCLWTSAGMTSRPNPEPETTT